MTGPLTLAPWKTWTSWSAFGPPTRTEPSSRALKFSPPTASPSQTRRQGRSPASASDSSGVAEPSDAVPDEAPPSFETLEEIYLDLPYIPEFLVEDVQFWFVPTFAAAKAVYHELIDESAKDWTAYYTKKGWSFIHETGEREGPYRVRDGGTHLDVLQPGKIFAPKPRVRLRKDGPPIPLPSLEKHRPINEWKPNYVKALNFIKKYDWPHAIPRRVTLSIWEIEECGQVAGSTSWINAERVLLASDSAQVRTQTFHVMRALDLQGDPLLEEAFAIPCHQVSQRREAIRT